MNDKLIQLADYLEDEVDDSKFRMDVWSSECGTAACALGWGTRIFSGLEFVPSKNDDIGIKFTDDNGDAHHALSAATSCFSISHSLAGELFFEHSYDDPSKENVVERLREHALHS